MTLALRAVFAAACSAAALILLQVVPLAAPDAQAAQAGPLAVVHPGGALHPGDIALVAVTASPAVLDVTGTAFGRRVAFWASDTPGEWHGLVGVALDTKPGSYRVAVRAAGTGSGLTGAVTLTVQAKQFETRRLTVSSQYVDPPASEAARIQREQKQLASIFAGSSPRLWHGPFMLPVPGRATSSFGRLTVLNGQPRGRHQGADFSAGVGTPVRAPNAGRVALAEDLYFSGNTVILDHGAGLFSLFAHLSTIAVEAGSVAARADLLGEAGATGRVTGPHLHWAVRLGEVSVDPLSLVRAVSGALEPPGPRTAR